MVSIDLEENKEKICKLLLSVERNNIEGLVEWLLQTDFFEAPCSTKYHLNVPGGLAHHSLCVYDALNELDEMCDTKLSDDTKIITSLLHDTCKIDLYKLSKGLIPYERNDAFPVGHGEKSIFVIQQFIPLSNQEVAMIRWHMGGYDESFARQSNLIQKYYPEAMLMYFADHISTLFRED